MLFNPDPSKPAQEVIFSRKKVQIHPTITLNNIQSERTTYQKHFGILLDEKLNFRQYIDTTILKVNKGFSVIKKLRHSLPRKSLVIHLRPQKDYGDMIYDQFFCEKKKKESVQYKAALAVTGVIQGTSREKIY